MSIDNGWNTNDGIRVNPSITIGSISPHITNLNSGTEMQIIGFGRNSGDKISPRNTGRFDIYNVGTLKF